MPSTLENPPSSLPDSAPEPSKEEPASKDIKEGKIGVGDDYLLAQKDAEGQSEFATFGDKPYKASGVDLAKRQKGELDLPKDQKETRRRLKQVKKLEQGNSIVPPAEPGPESFVVDTSTATPEVKESPKVPNVKWKIVTEPEPTTAEAKKILNERRHWLIDNFHHPLPKATITKISENIRQWAATDKPATLMDKRFFGNRPAVRVGLARLQDSLAQGQKSIDRFLDEASQEKDQAKLVALKLLSSALLDPYFPIDETKWHTLPEADKRLARLGEMIGLEVEKRQLALLHNQGSKVLPERAQKWHQLFSGYARSADLPPLFADRFMFAAKDIADQYNLPKPPRIKLPKAEAQELPRPPAAARAGEFYVYDPASGENKEAIKHSFYKSVEQRRQAKKNQLPESEKLSEVDRDYDIVPQEAYPERAAHQTQLQEYVPATSVDLADEPEVRFFQKIAHWWKNLFA